MTAPVSMSRYGAVVAMMFFLTLLPVNLYAQTDERQPGVYAVVGQESRPLEYASSNTLVTYESSVRAAVLHEVFRYRGDSSGVAASCNFVLVVNPELKRPVRTLKRNDFFIKRMKPTNMAVIPLTVNHGENRREYDPGVCYMAYNFLGDDKLDFDWERISENSYNIRVYGLVPGEYAIVFRLTKISEFDLTGIYCFSYRDVTF